MCSRIEILRRNGARLVGGNIAHKGQDGELKLYRSGGLIELKLSEPNDQRKQPIIPVLYDARLVTMHGGRMLSKGWSGRAARRPRSSCKRGPS